MRRFLVLLLLLAPAAAQTKHPFTFEDMMALKRVAEPVPSPDGKWVIFSVTDVDLAANTKTPHVWIVPTNGGTAAPGRLGEQSSPPSDARMIIANQDADRPRWAPDGKRFLFVSTKDGGAQVWIGEFDSEKGTVPATRRLTSIATEAGGALWSPDGKSILFVSDVYPECDGAPADEEACNAKKLDDAAKSKVKALVFTRLLYRHWNGYKEGRRTHIFVVPAEGGTPRDLTPGDYDSPVFSLGGQDNYAFSPDGQEICYTSNHDKVEATSTNNDLWIVPVGGGVAKNITADNPASDSTPLYSPDGKYIAYRAQVRPGYEADRFRLMLYERKTGEKKDFTERWDRWVGTFTWTPDSESVYLSAENEGKSPVYKLKVSEGYLGNRAIAPGEIVGGFNDDLIVTPDGKTVVFTRMSLAGPNEIHRAATEFLICEVYWKEGKVPLVRYEFPDCQLSKPVPLTHLNDAVLSHVAMSPIEPFWFEGAEKAKVQGFLVRPPNFDAAKKYPVKFLIHGGPQGAWGDDWTYRWNAELFAANGYVVVMINPRGSTGYGQKFIDDINYDWGGRVFEDLMKGLDYAEQHYPFIDKDRECALGASYGGYMVNWILGHTNRFKCLVSHDGTFNTESAWGTTEELWFNEWEFKGTPWESRDLYRKWSPHLSAPNFRTPTLVVHSQRDYRLDVSEGLQLFTTLQRMNVPSKMLYFPDEGHWVLKPQNSQLWYKTVNDWVDQWLKK
jgi:dipeptidyl aminopeptidase/acylaminoacyl peptidase